MNESIFQSIFDKLQDVLPASWNKVIFYAAYGAGSYSMKYYTDADGGRYVDCFSEPEVDRARLLHTFMDIDKELSAEREKLDEEERWTVLTMIADSKGNMKTDFAYEDLSETPVTYEKQWKKKYLV